MEAAVQTSRLLVENVGHALEGKQEVVELAVVTLLARGHLLIEDVPGVGKTTLARAIAKSIDIEMRRIQCTSDLLPTDVLGGQVYEPSTGEIKFRPGPVFTDILLADEINRATPRTQSALLEAMEERNVSLDGVTHALSDLFFVVATQNPQDFQGTHPLPESQLDRFLVRMEIGYPPPEVERNVLSKRRGVDPTHSMTAVISREALRNAQRAVNDVRVSDVVLDYLHNIVLATRNETALQYGASTRAAISFERAVRAYALVKGRAYVEPDDVKQLAVSVLAHRVLPHGTGGGWATHHEANLIIKKIVESTSVPL